MLNALLTGDTFPTSKDTYGLVCVTNEMQISVTFNVPM